MEKIVFVEEKKIYETMLTLLKKLVGVPPVECRYLNNELSEGDDKNMRT